MRHKSEWMSECEHQKKGCKNHVLMAHSSEGHKVYIQCPKPTTAGIPRNGLHQGQNKTQATEWTQKEKDWCLEPSKHVSFPIIYIIIIIIINYLLHYILHI